MSCRPQRENSEMQASSRKTAAILCGKSAKAAGTAGGFPLARRRQYFHDVFHQKNTCILMKMRYTGSSYSKELL